MYPYQEASWYGTPRKLNSKQLSLEVWRWPLLDRKYNPPSTLFFQPFPLATCSPIRFYLKQITTEISQFVCILISFCSDPAVFWGAVADMPLFTFDEKKSAAILWIKIGPDDQIVPTDPAAFVGSLFRDQDAILSRVIQVISPKIAQFVQGLP